MANEENQVLSVIRGKRTTYYHTIALGKFSIEKPKRIITSQASGRWHGMSVPGGHGSATPPEFETFQQVTEFKWDPTTGEIVVEVGSGEKYNNKSGLNVVMAFDQSLILVWDPTSRSYKTTDKQWVAGAEKEIAQNGADLEYRVNEATDCVISVGGHKHMSWNLKGLWLKDCYIFEDDPTTPNIP